MHLTKTARLTAIITLTILICGVTGCGLGIEKPANTGTPLMHIRDRFEFKYPGNWKIITTDREYDPDHNLIINTPGASMIAIMFIEMETDTRGNIQEMAASFGDLIKSPEKTEFTSWGKYSGHGMKLEGNTLGIRMTVKFFSYSGKGVSFIIAMQSPDEDYHYVSKGYDQIAKTFKLK